MLRNYRFDAALAVFLWFSASPLWALNPNYNFTIPVVNGQVIGGLTVTSIQSPQIDNFGRTIFFGGYLAGSTYGAALYTPNSIVVKTGDNIGGHVIAGLGLFALDRATGVLVFVAVDPSGSSLLFEKRDGAQPKLLAASGQHIEGLTLRQMNSVAVNAFGFVAFGATYTDSRGNPGTGVFTPGNVLAEAGETVDHNVLSTIDTDFVGLSLIDVYFSATTRTGAVGIFTTRQTIAITGETIGGNQITQIDYPAVNAFGDLVFAALTKIGAGLFNPPRVIFTQTYPLDNFPAAINDFGAVAYGGATGVMINNTSLIAGGDLIGSALINGFSFPVSLNDVGQLVFAGNIGGASDALILATPKR